MANYETTPPQEILADEAASERLLKSYEMMLDFYGMKLDRKNGDITDNYKGTCGMCILSFFLLLGNISRSEKWRDRFRHLNRSMHNYLRITRILKCLGEFGFEHYKSPFVRFVLREAILERTLTGTLESCMNYWVEVIKEDKERQDVRKYAESLVADSNSKQPH